MIHDGLWDPYGDTHMGGFGDSCSKELDITREAQDNLQGELRTCSKAQQEGWFKSEIVPVEIKGRKGTVVVDTDEEPGMFRPDKMASLRPAFGKEGTVTAANASKIDDGAAALVLMSREEAEKRGMTIVASWVSDGTFAQDPAWFTTAPVGAMKKALDKASLSADAIDCYEINEAFSMVTLAAMRELGLITIK